jgi:hypothetical protein
VFLWLTQHGLSGNPVASYNLEGTHAHHEEPLVE